MSDQDELLLTENSSREDREGRNSESETGNSSYLQTISTRFSQHLNVVARKFNILDRWFGSRRSGEQAGGLHVGASADGVFSNLMAKPEQRGPSDSEEDKPPTYAEAAADMVPPYYGIDDDGVGMYFNEICIDGLPVGNMFNFLWNLVVCFSFQFVGFLLTYILHTSHAARQGSRFGLGATFVGYGYSMIPNDVSKKIGKDNQLNRYEFEDPDSYSDMHLYMSVTTKDEFESKLSNGAVETAQSTPALAYLVIIFGGLIMLKSVWDYILVRRMERRFLSESNAEEIETA